MNRIIKILSLAIFIVALAACNQQQPNLSLAGNINVEQGKIYLQSFRNKMFFVIDSTEIENGQFRFTRHIDHEDLYGLTLNRNEEMFPWFIFLEEGNINVSIDTADRYQIAVTGSQSQILYSEYLANRQNFNIDSFIENNPKSVVAAYILYRDYSTRLTTAEMETSINRFDSSLNNISYIEELNNVVDTRKRMQKEGEAIDFAGKTPDGSEISLSDFYGNYLLLRFWASWCGPCRRDNPAMVRVSEKYRDQGFQIFAVSLDNNQNAWINAIAADGLNWNHVSDLKLWDSEPAKLYGVRHIPATFLIDPSGKIIERNIKGDELDLILEKLYKEKQLAND
jgi:thiol-disulfide isomerase/thioredoxin